MLLKMYWAFGIVLHKFFIEEETAMNYTYIVQCADGTLYTGWTNCLARRMIYNEGSRLKQPGQKAGEAGVLRRLCHKGGGH